MEIHLQMVDDFSDAHLRWEYFTYQDLPGDSICDLFIPPNVGGHRLQPLNRPGDFPGTPKDMGPLDW